MPAIVPLILARGVAEIGVAAVGETEELALCWTDRSLGCPLIEPAIAATDPPAQALSGAPIFKAAPALQAKALLGTVASQAAVVPAT
jgi:hypothetical protein